MIVNAAHTFNACMIVTPLSYSSEYNMVMSGLDKTIRNVAATAKRAVTIRTAAI